MTQNGKEILVTAFLPYATIPVATLEYTGASLMSAAVSHTAASMAAACSSATITFTCMATVFFHKDVKDAQMIKVISIQNQMSKNGSSGS